MNNRQSSTRCSVGFCVSLLIASWTASAQSPVQPRLSIANSGVTVSNVPPGGEIVLLSCAKVMRDRANHLDVQPRLLTDSDGDGTITLQTPVALRSVWIAVDVRSGGTAVASHPLFPLYVRDIAPALYRKSARGEIEALEKRIPRLILLLVRPDKGAWLLSAREGEEGDRDGMADGHLRIAFADALPLPGSTSKDKAPATLKPGDVLAAIDPGQLDVFLGQVIK